MSDMNSDDVVGRYAVLLPHCFVDLCCRINSSSVLCKELQDIVNKLGSGNVSLDESLKLYTRGIELSKLCDEKLKEIEQKFSVVDPSTGEVKESEVK